ncbi:unnamed protein product, partial [Linum tenue]
HHQSHSSQSQYFPSVLLTLKTRSSFHHHLLTPSFGPFTFHHRHNRHHRRKRKQVVATDLIPSILSGPVASAAKERGDQSTIQTRN